MVSNFTNCVVSPYFTLSGSTFRLVLLMLLCFPHYVSVAYGRLVNLVDADPVKSGGAEHSSLAHAWLVTSTVPPPEVSKNYEAVLSSERFGRVTCSAAHSPL
eukprot:SAG31_NODE_2697_length_5227_cov_1.318643_6_plen_102_part_00